MSWLYVEQKLDGSMGKKMEKMWSLTTNKPELV